MGQTAHDGAVISSQALGHAGHGLAFPFCISFSIASFMVSSPGRGGGAAVFPPAVPPPR